MSQPSGTIPFRTRFADRLRQTFSTTIWGGMLLSLVLHGVLVGFLIWRMRPLGDGEAGEKGQAEFHTVGVILKSPQKNKTVSPATRQQSPSENNLKNRFSSKPLNSSPNEEVSKKPPIGIGSTRKIGQKTDGPGRGVPSILENPNPGGIRPNVIGVQPTPGTKRPGDGTTSFFKIRDKGKRIVYLLDGSGSMFGKPIQLAKSQLIGSLNSLIDKQKFQIIFYNDSTHPLRVGFPGSDPLAPASIYYIQRAKLKLESVLGRGGTNHKLALHEALSKQHSPDVIFFLTDAKNGLDRADLQTVKDLNKSNARIHCIQFGEGADFSQGNNFLKKLAEMNRGSFRYVDVERY